MHTLMHANIDFAKRNVMLNECERGLDGHISEGLSFALCRRVILMPRRKPNDEIGDPWLGEKCSLFEEKRLQVARPYEFVARWMVSHVLQGV